MPTDKRYGPRLGVSSAIIANGGIVLLLLLALGVSPRMLLAIVIFVVFYNAGVMLALKGFAAAILGGYGSMKGAVIGGLLLGTLESLGAGYISSAFKDAFAFLLLLLVLFIRPAGLFGRKEIKRV